MLADKPASKRGDVKGIKPDRGDVILGGALVLAAAMERAASTRIEVTEAGLREGVFFERLLGEPRAVRRRAARVGGEPRPPLQLGARARRPRGRAVAARCSTGSRAPGCTSYGDDERELLWAACVLHDIGTAIDYDDHHRHSHYLILNAGLPGFTPRELVLVGLIARYHRKGDPDASELGDLAEPGDDERLRLLCAIIRLAEQFERSRDGAIRRVSVGPATAPYAGGGHRPGARPERADLGRPPQRGPARAGAGPRGRDRP